MKNSKLKLVSNNAITLIALIVTIIILLILAGVTIAMLTGENGILNKAINAKERTLEAQYEEELNMCILEMQTDELYKGKSVSMETIIKKLPVYIQEAQQTTDYEWDIDQTEEEPKGIYKGYNFYIDKSYKAHIEGIATGITINTKVTPSGYTNQNVTAVITIKSSIGISKIISENNTLNCNGKTEVAIDYNNIDTNRGYTYEIEDINGNKETKTAQITNIDKLAPKVFTITAQATDDGITITGNTEDAEETGENACSGIEKYEYYVTDASNNTTQYDTNEITELKSGTYSVYSIAYDKAGNPKQSNTVSNIKIVAVIKNITAEMIANKPTEYYGKAVTNYTSLNGQSNWKIFYSNGTNIFLIAGDYLQNSKIDKTAIGMTTDGTYRAWWASAPSMQEVTENTKTLFMATRYNLNSSNDNSKCVSTLLNTANWKNFKDTGNKAVNAIGSPTIEMWMESWNQLYPNDKLYCNNTDNYGYYIGTTSGPTTSEIKVTTMKEKAGYENKLYFPYNTETSDTCKGYWISSPRAGAKNRMYFWSSGNLGVGTPTYTNNYACLRPVVALDSGITVNLTE